LSLAVSWLSAAMRPRGAKSSTPIAGEGVAAISEALQLGVPEVQLVGSDVYIRARVLHV